MNSKPQMTRHRIAESIAALVAPTNLYTTAELETIHAILAAPLTPEGFASQAAERMGNKEIAVLLNVAAAHGGAIEAVKAYRKAVDAGIEGDPALWADAELKGRAVITGQPAPEPLDPGGMMISVPAAVLLDIVSNYPEVDETYPATHPITKGRRLLASLGLWDNKTGAPAAR